MGFDLTATPGGAGVIAPAPESAIWSGPHGGNSDCSPDYRQVTDTDPGTTWVAGYPGALAADAGLLTDAQWASFRTEFPTAIPGWLHGILYISWGNSYAYVDDMYNSSPTSTKCYRDRESWAYSSNYFSMKKLLYPRVSTGGMWWVGFAKPIPFYLGLRVSYDNGSCFMYFLYTLRGAL